MAVQTSPESTSDVREPSFTSLILVIGLLLVLGGALAVATAPLSKLLGGTAHTWIGAYHGVAAAVLMLVAVISVYLGVRLAPGRTAVIRDLQVLSVVTAALSFITIVFGNWLYITYRGPDSAKTYFVANVPELHQIFFEFKEFIALFTLPLAVAAAFILLRYGEALLNRPWLRSSVVLLLGLVFFFFLIAFGLGAAITKIKAV